jgi:DTW domain-containing protein YfiP
LSAVLLWGWLRQSYGIRSETVSSAGGCAWREHRTKQCYAATRCGRNAVCICGSAPRLDLATRVIMVIHAVEWRRPSNTGHLARLALANAEIRLQGLRHRPVSGDGIDPASPSTLVLYPGRGADPLTAEALAARPLTLLVPDGNWVTSADRLSPTQRMRRFWRCYLRIIMYGAFSGSRFSRWRRPIFSIR